MMRRLLAFSTAGLTLLLVGCAVVSPAPPVARCAATAVVLLEPAPLFTGPQANAALDQALPKGKAVQLCGEQGQRRQVLLPRPGQRCTSATDCAGGWIPRATRTGPRP